MRRYESLLRDHRSDAYRAWLHVLSLPQLSVHVSRGRRGLRGLHDGGVTDLVASMPGLARRLRIDLRALSGPQQSGLMQDLAEVQLRIDREDLDFARDLLEQRRRSSFRALADEVVADLVGEPDP